MSSLSPSDLGEDARQDYGEEFPCSEDHFFSSQSSTITNLPHDILTGSDSVTMVSQDGFEIVKPIKTIVEKTEAFITPDEEARLFSAPGSDVNSPRDMVSPSAGSSPFSAMESDGEGIETGMDDASLSGVGDTSFQRNNGFYGASTPLEYTTTPCASSSACDDDYESTGSRKKRRRTRRDINAMYPTPVGNGIASLRFMRATTQEPWQQDQETSPFSPPTCPKAMNFNFAENSSRRGSGSAVANALLARTEESDENAKRPRTCDNAVNGDELQSMSHVPVKIEMPVAMETPVTKGTVRRHNAHRAEEEQILLKQFPRKIDKFELKIVTQPESQHRARYLTEGSRGPVKDGTQRGFPEVQLLGYNGPATLQVFVATDSGKVKPHGFYQACRVTGRNTSPCDETEIDGTKVIEIPFKHENMLLSIDCVGILKLRNTDVEVRTGIRNPKRNQSVRLAFRVVVNTASGENTTLQVASSRISCTQPLGQPEITKKSVDRCSVEGGVEMFIIGKNFHRGTKVIYQDPEDPNGAQWSAEGEVDKDTFHQSHMVVRVPPYHDLDINKPVNVQLLVEFQDKRCEPHSFTYMPRQKEPEPSKEEQKKTTQPAQNQSNIATPSIQSALNLLEGPIDKKFLVALFSKLLSTQNDNTVEVPEPAKTEVKIQASNIPTLTAPLVNAAGPILQGVLQPLPTQTVLEVVEPMKAEVNPNPASVPITTNPFANLQFTLQPKMSFTQDLNSAVVQTPANPTSLVTPVTRISFTPNPAQGTTNPLSNISFTQVPSGGAVPASQVVFNPQNVVSTNPNLQFTSQTVQTAGMSTLASQIQPNPFTPVGLPTSVVPSVGNMSSSFSAQSVKVKSETSIPDVMPNAVTSNVQTIPVMAPISSPPTAFNMCVPQAAQVSVAFSEKPQEQTPPPMVVSPVSQPQPAQEAVLYNSFVATHAEVQPNSTSALGSVPASFIGNNAVKIDQPTALSFSNQNSGQVSTQSLPPTFDVSTVSNVAMSQQQTQPITNFQVTPGQHMQQNLFAHVTVNQSTPFGVANPPASLGQGNMGQSTALHAVETMAQSVTNSGNSFSPDQIQMRTTVVQQMPNSFENPFAEKETNKHNTVQIGQTADAVQSAQTSNIVGAQQFTMATSQHPLQTTNLPSQTQQQFKVAVQEPTPMQQEQQRNIQEQPPQSIPNFGLPEQQQFVTGITDIPMTQEQPSLVVTQQQLAVNNHQQQKPGFNELSSQQFTIVTQDQPIQQILQPPQAEISQQQAFSQSGQGQPMPQHPTTGQGQAMSQQQSVQITQQTTVQIAPQPNLQIAQQPNLQISQQPIVQISQQTIAQQPNVQIAQQSNVQMAQQPSVPMSQQPGVQITQQPIPSQIVQQVCQASPVITHSSQPQDNQMHIDPFIEPQSGTSNLHSQQTSNVFNTQPVGQQNANSQPMEDIAMASITNQTGDQHMKDISMAQHQQSPQEQTFNIQHQTASPTVVSEVGNTFLGQTPAGIVAMNMQPVVSSSVIPAQEFQSIPQPSNPTLVVIPEQNSTSAQQINSTSNQESIMKLATAQTFQHQSNSQTMSTEAAVAPTIRPQQYQSPEASQSPQYQPPVASPPSLPTQAQSGFLATPPAQSQQNSEQMQMPNKYAFQNANDAQMQQQANTRSSTGNNVSLQQRALAANISVTHSLEPRSPDLFAMTQLLQSIDGSTNLERISGEDVRRHCQ